ncbi:MAG: hypothetical protein ABSG13_00120 [Bryobacteraceae bacterium]|jgi:hypothetical protein
MRTLALSSLVLLAGFAAFGQDSSELFDKAPPPIDEALRARVDKFYGAFIAGKFKDAYLLVADDSQDKFFELSKDQYKGCEIIKIRYRENFTKAAVVTSCKADWRFHGTVVLTTFPLTSNWEVIDGQWVWHYEKPTMVPSPFSPTGFVNVPPDSTPSINGLVPKDIPGAAQGILAKVSVDKTSVRLRPHETSQDVVHVRNDMPGQVSLKVDKPDIEGLKITVGKTDLQAHDETTVTFEWRSDEPTKTMSGHPTVQLRIEPTGQVFPISIAFEDSPTQTAPAPQK